MPVMTNRDNSVVNGVRGSAEGSGNGSVGFVAGKSVSNSVLPLAGLGKRYQAVGSDDEGRVDTAGRSAKVGSTCIGCRAHVAVLTRIEPRL